MLMVRLVNEFAGVMLIVAQTDTTPSLSTTLSIAGIDTLTGETLKLAFSF